MESASPASLISSVCTTLTQSLSLQERLQRCAETLVQHSGRSCARIWTLNAWENVLELEASAGVCSSPSAADRRVPLGGLGVGLMAQERQPLVSDAVPEDTRIPDQEWAKREGMIAFAGYPLVVGERLLGAMALFASQPMPEPALQALACVANTIALCVEGGWAEDALRALEEYQRRAAEEIFRLASIVQSSEDAILSYALDGTIVSWNAGAERLYGYTADEIVGKPGSILIPAGREGEVGDLLAKVRRGERIDQYETARLTKDGRQVDVSLTVSPIRDSARATIAVAVIARDITERRKKDEALRQLSGRLLQLQDKERARVARELHDSTAQNLVALEITLSLVSEAASGLEPKARQALSSSIALVRECAQETRTLSYLLHPLLLDELGLGSALRAYADTYTRRTGLEIALEIPDVGRLPREAEITVFRVAQEALMNVHRHSGSRRAMVRVVPSPKEIVLEVKDEGRGIPPEVLQKIAEGTAKSVVGILGMQERLRQLGGLLEIQSDSHGTTVRAVLFLPRENA